MPPPRTPKHIPNHRPCMAVCRYHTCMPMHRYSGTHSMHSPLLISPLRQRSRQMLVRSLHSVEARGTVAVALPTTAAAPAAGVRVVLLHGPQVRRPQARGVPRQRRQLQRLKVTPRLVADCRGGPGRGTPAGASWAGPLLPGGPARPKHIIVVVVVVRREPRLGARGRPSRRLVAGRTIAAAA